MKKKPLPDVRKIAFLGDYLPRRCGIATFTTDICRAVGARYPETTCFAVPVNDQVEGYAYPPEVRFEIEETEVDSYQRAANYLNLNDVELVSVQHEFGIYGGPAGSHLLALLRRLRMPAVITLHTVLREPNDDQRRVMKELNELAARFVVMTERGAQFLRETYGMDDQKIVVIPHGIPDTPFVDPNYYKDKFEMDGKKVILTFGLLSPNKGIEVMIDALPRVVAKYPEVQYMVLGATHPHLIKKDGETYRLSLQRRAEANGVKKHVVFYNQFVEHEQLMEFIGAADLYVTPYLNEAQITSGTLAYSFGAGKAVISTPYWHAQELLADDRGRLVPFNDSNAMADAILDLLDHENRRNTIRRNAYKLGREMIWPRVAERYMDVFREVRSTFRPRIRPTEKDPQRQASYDLPPLKLDHLFHLTDSTGLIQHAVCTVPNFEEGYTTDDNARALILSVMLESTKGAAGEQLRLAATRYFGFLVHAFDRERRSFRNFMSYQRFWLDEPGTSQDCHGRAVWALGTVIGRSENPGFCKLAAELFEMSCEPLLGLISPRSWAFGLLAIHEYLRRYHGDSAANKVRDELGERLFRAHCAEGPDQWPWFEDRLAYDNAVLPHALILTGHWTGQKDMLERGLETLRWLADLQTAEGGHFTPIGSNGFYTRGGEQARYDQQPLEASATISACLEAHRITNDPYWSNRAQIAFEWFLGRNDLSLPLYDSATGGCRDGLHWDRVNLNEGAESTLAFYLALTEMRKTRDALTTFQRAPAA